MVFAAITRRTIAIKPKKKRARIVERGSITDSSVDLY
jgi:hypothetical protein